MSGQINRDLANWLMAQRLEIERVMQTRLGAAAPAASGPEAETLRRFRTFVSTALMRGEAPRPVLDGLRPNERRVMALLSTWAEAACQLAGPDADAVGTALAPLLDAFRLAIRTTGSKRKTSGRPRATRRAITAAIDRISDLFFAIDVDSGEILDANPASGAALGVARDALIGLEFNAFVPVDAQGPWWTSLDTIAEGQDSHIFEAAMQDRESRRIPLEVSATRFIRSSNRTLALVVARPKAIVETVAEPAQPSLSPAPSSSVSAPVPAPAPTDRPTEIASNPAQRPAPAATPASPSSGNPASRPAPPHTLYPRS